MDDRPAFPGAVGVSHLRVYDTVAPDGLRGGTPHLHTVCTEAYAVIAGRGSVQTLSSAGFAEVPLAPGAFVWFTPGTVHRLVNGDGHLELFVIMQNSGLPEAGDMVCTFPDEHLAADRYEAASTLPADDVDTTGPGDAARARRDLAVAGFGVLRADVEQDGPRALSPFHDRAAALVRDRTEKWRAVWEQGPLAAAQTTGEQLDALARGDGSHLGDASIHRIPPPGDPRRFGCCGTLGVYVS